MLFLTSRKNHGIVTSRVSVTVAHKPHKLEVVGAIPTPATSSDFPLPRDGIAHARAYLALGVLRACAMPSGEEGLRFWNYPTLRRGSDLHAGRNVLTKGKLSLS